MSKLEDSLKKLKKNLESSDAKKRRTTNNDTSGTAKKAQKAKKKSSSEGYKRRETNEPAKHRINGGGSNTASSDGYKRRITNKTALPKGSFADRFKKDTADFKKRRITSETRDQRDSRIRQEYGKRPEVKKSKVLSEEKRIERARNITPGGGYTPDVYKGLDENRDTVDALVNRAFEGTAAAFTGAYDAGVTLGNATINKYAGRIGRITGKDPRDFEINGKKIWEYQKDVQESSEDAWKTISGYDQKAIEKLESEGKVEAYLGEISSAIGFMLPSLVTGAGAGSIAGNAVLGVTAAGAETNSIYYQLRDKRLEDGAMTKKDFTDIVNRAGLTGAAVGTGEILTEKLTGGLPIFGKGIVDTFAGRTARGMLSKESREAIDAFNKTMRGKIITTAMKRGFGAVGEGAEEVIMEAAQPLMERIIAGVDSDYATIEDLKKSFGMGAVISLLFGFSPDTIQYGMAVAQKVEENKFEKGVKDYVKVGLASAVKNGEMTREEAENHYQRLVDNLSGKGDIEGSDVVRRTDTESKVTSEDSKVYETKQEAVNSLNSDLKSKSIGDTVSAVYTDESGTHTVTGKVSELQGGKVLVGVREGITTEADTRRYAAKLEQVKSAKNITERTGAQLNVRPELVKEMSELSEALGRPVIFEDVAGKQTNRGTMMIERGWFDKDGIHINVHSNATAGYVVAHEMTHAMEGTKGYKTFRNFIYDYYKSSTGAEEARLLGLYGKLVKPEDVSTEVIANFVETKLFSDPATIAEFVKANPTLSDRFVMGLNRVIQRTAGTKEQRFLSKARSLWVEGIEESKEYANSVEYDKDLEATSDTGQEVQYGIGIELDGSLAKTEKEANKKIGNKYLDEEALKEAVKLRKEVAEQFGNLFIPDQMTGKDVKGKNVSPLQKNGSYGKTLDSSTVCSRSLVIEYFVEEMARRLGRPLRNEEAVILAQEMVQYTGDRAECIYCYQANAKRGYEDALAKYFDMRQAVIDRYNAGVSDKKNYALMRGKGKDNDTKRERFDTFIKIAKGDIEGVAPLMAVNTETLNRNIANEDLSETMRKQLIDMKKYAQGSVKAHGRVYYAVYNGQILNIKEEDVERMNNEYGLRMYSFSDFSPAFILENMQMVTDAAIKGFKVFAYTKEPEFVDIFAGTGMAINLSITGYKGEDGNYYPDGMMGMDWEKAKKYRRKYPAVGTVYVAKSDDEVEWALKQKWIDCVIPFHISYGSKMMSILEGWTNYSGLQTEKSKVKIPKGKTKPSIHPAEFQNDKETYLRLCEEKKLYPRFKKWVNNENYMKLVNETRLAPKDMQVVQPVFNKRAINKSLSNFAGYTGKDNYFERIEKAIEPYVDDIEAQIRKKAPLAKQFYDNSKKLLAQNITFTDFARQSAYGEEEYLALAEDPEKNEARLREMVYEAAKEAGYPIRAYHGTKRADRVGNVFRPDRATSGPMAFFTDNYKIAENYSNDKSDTSINYDSDYGSYETQFRAISNKSNRDMPLYEAWRYIPFSERNKIKQKAGQLRYGWDNDDYDSFILDEDNISGLGDFVYILKNNRGNVIRALTEEWLDNAELLNEEDRFFDVLELTGITDALKKIGFDIEYKDPNYEEKKVYDTYLGITKPFDTESVDEDFVRGFERWYKEQDRDIYEKETASVDFWDKNNVSADEFAVRLRDDIKNGTTHSWTSIPDSATDYLKSLGYNGIKDKGGKHHDTIHTVWIPFYSNQVKSADPVVYDNNGNIIPLSERFNPDNDDIRYAYGEEKVSSQMKTVVKEFGNELKEVSYSRSRADNAEMKNRVNGMLNEILRTGTYSNKTVSDVIDFIYDTGYRKMENEREYELWGKGTKIVIPEDLRGEMETFGGLGAVNKKLYGHGLTFTYQNTSGAMRLDEAYREFREMNPVLGEDDVEDIVDPSIMVENIVDAYTAKTAKVPLYVLDEREEEELGEDVYRKDIEEKVYNLADAVARQAAYENGKAAEKRGEKKGEEKGIAKGVKQEQKAQSKRDMATMRAFDDLLTKITKEQRKADEATLREYDKLLKQVQKDAEKLTEAEKKKLNKKINAMRDDFDRELQRQIKAFQRERKKANESELKTFDRIMRSERSKQNAAEKQNTELKGQNKQLKSDVAKLQKERLDTLKEYDRMLKTHMAEEERKRIQKMDEADRKEAIARRKQMQKIARELRNAKTEAERKENAGTAKEKMRYSGKAKRVAESLRTDIVTYLAESGAFGKTENGLVLLDENGAEIAVKTNDKWKLSKYKNISTPSLGTALVAEQYGFDVDQFYTIYSKIVNMKGKKVSDPKNPGKKKIIFTKQQKVTDYINSLKLTAEQKRFLYLDVAKYAKSKMPTFLNGGKLVEAKGNKNGRLYKAIDQLAVNMYAGYYSRNSSYEESVANKIKLQDIADIADIVYKEDSEEKTKFEMYLTEAVINHAEDMDIVRLKEEVNLLTETPKEKDNLRTRVLNTWRRAKRDFLAEGEAYERMAKQCHDPRIAAAYYSAKNFQTIADNMMTGDQRNIVGGEKMGKSLKSIFDPILKADEKAGNDNKMALLTKFVNARHDIDRAAADKGYTGRTIEENIAIVEKVKKENPDIVAVADEIVEYSRNLLMMCVDSGRISKETYDYFIAKYPNYVPTFRVQEGTVDRNGKIVSRDIKVIREAKGGNEDVLPLYDQLARRTKEIVKSCKNNQLATYLAMSFRKHEADDFISSVVEAEEKKNRDAESESVHEIGTVENMGKAWNEAGRENNIPVFIDGVKYNIVCKDENLLYGWDRINYYADENTLSKALREVNNVRRGILTQYNPTFWATNGIRDTFDLYLYNQHAHRLPKFHAEAYAIIFGGKLSKGRMFKNGEEMWQEYLSRGAAEASIFEYANIRKGKQTKASKAKKIAGMPLEAFDTLNFMVEQTPRFAMYLETIDRLTKEQKKGKNDYTEDEIKTIAAYQAADATLNFGRSGTVAKWANSHGAVFLNASIQGMDKFFRMLSPFAETGKNFKRWVNTAKEADKAGVLFDRAEEGSEEEAVAGAEYERLWNKASEAQQDFLMSALNIGTLCLKLLGIGVVPVAIAKAFYTSDDDFWKKLREYFYGKNADKVKREYEEMSDYNVINYLMINIGGEWFRLPAGHVMTVLRGGFVNIGNVLDGRTTPIDALAEEASLFWDKVGMNNPLTNNVFTPLLDTWVNKDHWGNDIVSSWEEKKDGFHYLEADEDTTLAAQKIANFMHYVTGTVWGKEDSILDLSPKKIDYIIEQYAGSYYDLIMPFFSGKTMTDNALSMATELAKKFYVDPVDSNRLAGDYYDTKDLYESIADKYDDDTPYAMAAKAFDEYDKELKGLRDEMKAISADTSLSRKERLKKIKAIKEKMNKLYRKGISDAQYCLEYGKANYTGVDDNSDIYEDAMGELRGSEYLYETLPDSAKGKYETCASTTDIDKGTFYDAYKQIGSLSSDRDANGKEIEGQGKQDKIIKYLDNLDIPSDQKDALWTNMCGYSDKNKPTFQSGSKGGVSLGNVVSPIQGKGTISSHFGYRKAPTAGASSYHQAVDIAIPVGTPVGAAMAGTVTSISDKSTGYGKSVEVTTQDANGNIIVTKYSHMSEFGVEVGDHLEQGQQLGKSGNTGTSKGPHLDFKVGLNNKWVDPEEYFDFSQAGIVDGKGYSTKSTPGGSSVNYGSSGGGKKGGGRKGGGGKSSGGGSIGSATASASRYTSTTSSIPTGSSSSGSSGSSSGSSSKYRQTASSFNTATLPRANVTGRSTQSATYGQKGVMLPRANQTNTSIAYNKTGGVSRTGRTGRSGGSMWNDSILS